MIATKKTLTTKQCQELYDKAHAAGMAAAKKTFPAPMVVVQHADPMNDNSPVVKSYYVHQGVCGFAWVNVKPGNSKFAKWMIEQGVARPDSYNGGVTRWVREFNQSMELKEAYAHAFCNVLNAAGIKAYVGSRMD